MKNSAEYFSLMFFASGDDDGTVRVWNPYTGKELKTLEGHTGPVSCVAFSPDGTTLASASDDYTIKLWNPYTGKELKTLEGHTGPVSCVTFSPNGKLLVSVSYDTSIKVWDYSQGCFLANLTGHEAAVRCVTFHFSPASPSDASQGKVYWDVKLASADQNGSIHVYRTANKDTQTLDRVLPLPPEGWKLEQSVLQQSEPIYSIASHRPTGALISGSHDGKVKVWDLSTGKTLHIFEAHQRAVSCLAVSPSGNIIVSGSLDRTIRIWRMPQEDHHYPPPVSYPFAQNCPLCQQRVTLAKCKQVSITTLDIRNTPPIKEFQWWRVLRSKTKGWIIPAGTRPLCPQCDYAFPPRKLPDPVPTKKPLILIILILIAVIVGIVFLSIISHRPQSTSTLSPSVPTIVPPVSLPTPTSIPSPVFPAPVFPAFPGIAITPTPLP